MDKAKIKVILNDMQQFVYMVSTETHLLQGLSTDNKTWESRISMWAWMSVDISM
jgi:hypothetical protein